MQIRFLTGPAGSGKTFRCLSGIRQELQCEGATAPLILITPKQSTFQLERQLLADPKLEGYTRLHILSFERLARLVFQCLGRTAPETLDEEGRVMVLRSLLARKREDLKLFRASARLTGFAQQLSLALSELQRNQQTPASLRALATQIRGNESLAYKLQDLALLLEEYLAWLEARGLQDADCLLTSATKALTEEAGGVQASDSAPAHSQLLLTGLTPGARATASLELPSQGRFSNLSIWVDGFAEFSEQELSLLAALVPYSKRLVMAFCLEPLPAKGVSWLSNWSLVSRTFQTCDKRLSHLEGVTCVTESLGRDTTRSRFPDSPALRHLERHWPEPRPFQGASVGSAVRLVSCADSEAEAVLAAREVLAHVRKGGRFRDIAVLVRDLEGYHEPLQRVFSRYEIPFFLDRRELVSHHPLAELTRSALRTVAFQWAREDWFAALKTGLVPAGESDIDRLENEALARGWNGSVWQKPLVIKDDPELTAWLGELGQRLLPPFQRLAMAVAMTGNRPTGVQIATAVREFWRTLQVQEQLRHWAESEPTHTDWRVPSSVHATVWEQMNTWLDNVELAFGKDALSLREWLPVFEAGLTTLSVGVIPPALDQVLIGAIDRSRNPDLKLALVLGLNERVFPAPPQSTTLLTETDRAELEKHHVLFGTTARQHLGRERYLAYIACTRARERLVLTYALRDHDGGALNPSPFVSHVCRLFPDLRVEPFSGAVDWSAPQHACELIIPLLKSWGGGTGAGQISPPSGGDALERLPFFSSVIERLRHFRNPGLERRLSPALARKLYGPVLRTSVSRIEQFAACPFRFFVHSGLRAEERKQFELDIREQGSFQHDVLAMFHTQLAREGKRWRDITPAEARTRVARIVRGLVASYRDGLLEASEETKFMARVLTESLQDFVETLVVWMREQYAFDPVAVELPFGEGESSPAWSVDLGGGQRLELYGRIDRVDLCPSQDGKAWCVVIDYKSSQKQLDPILMAHGLQLQLLSYLNVLCRWPEPHSRFGVRELIPAGVFYVNLKGKYDRESNRLDALADTGEARKLAYRHAGRFDLAALSKLDTRLNAQNGDQFNYRRVKDGSLHRGCREPLPSEEFAALLERVQANLCTMGRRIFEGVADLSPYRKGSATACDQCDYQAICRIDPWTHQFRVLIGVESEEQSP